MKSITYLVEGRKTELCWQDDANMKIVHGPAIELGRVDDIGKIPSLACNFFQEHQCRSGDIDYFVTVMELDNKGKNLGQRGFTVTDFCGPQPNYDESEIIAITLQLVKNGETRV